MNKERDALIKQMRLQGLSYSEIGKHFKITRQRANYIFNKPSTTRKCKVCGDKFFVGPPLKIFCLKCHLIFNHLKGRDRTREFVRMRDKQTCQKCKKVWQEGQRKFDIHHLNGLCGFLSKGYDSIKNINGLITYCHKCHMNLHEVRKKISNKTSPRHNK